MAGVNCAGVSDREDGEVTVFWASKGDQLSASRL